MVACFLLLESSPKRTVVENVDIVSGDLAVTIVILSGRCPFDADYMEAPYPGVA
jgi:hypothetical protein